MTMHDCPDGAMRDLLPLHVTGALPDADRVRVESHLASCAECLAEVGLLRAVSRAYPALAVNVPAIAARIAPPRRARAASVPFHRQPLWRVAASLTFFIVGTATVLVVKNRAPSADRDAVARNAVATPGGATATLAETTIAASGGAIARTRATGLLSLGTELSELTDAQLESLLGSLDGLDSRPQADPTTIAAPIIQERNQAPGRSNQ